ncbi:hypothetical protein KIPB_011132, partial [Kipferlia bialata]|eukprot:g11132.t1
MTIPVDFEGNRLVVRVETIQGWQVPAETAAVVSEDSTGTYGFCYDQVWGPRFTKARDTRFQISGQSSTQTKKLFDPSFNLEDYGIGGLDSQFSDIFRRAFTSRVFPPEMIRRMGLRHTKGILLYGPPGTGKTLLARQIGRMLNCKTPKVVSGPEILSKYVGQAEENLRALFSDAEKDYQEMGDDSDLHLIIFDEIDAICKSRGGRSDSTGVYDSMVNQLLAKMEGVDELHNILIIGMTNRKDLIDSALL